MAERCNGELAHPPVYSKKACELFKAQVGAAREFMRPLLKTGLAGDRFNSDEKVLLTLRSNVPEDMFLADVERWVVDALLGCAQRDHWYQFEKKWD